MPIRIQYYWGDWKAKVLCYPSYYGCQMSAFSFSNYRYNNPLVDQTYDKLDALTPSGV